MASANQPRRLRIAAVASRVCSSWLRCASWSSSRSTTTSTSPTLPRMVAAAPEAETTSTLLIESTRSPLSSPAASAIPSRCSRETSAPGEGQAQSQGDGQEQG